MADAVMNDGHVATLRHWSLLTVRSVLNDAMTGIAQYNKKNPFLFFPSFYITF